VKCNKIRKGLNSTLLRALSDAVLVFDGISKRGLRFRNISYFPTP